MGTATWNCRVYECGEASLRRAWRTWESKGFRFSEHRWRSAGVRLHNRYTGGAGAGGSCGALMCTTVPIRAGSGAVQGRVKVIPIRGVGDDGVGSGGAPLAVAPCQGRGQVSHDGDLEAYKEINSRDTFNRTSFSRLCYMSD
ncbi:hypothetical protein E2C01_075297 [Portunus trituberculatus]|uniref:Uncharacterized protein n=1 Tax=Portunus trituberculatus TaxID=210409 RepID=A0A5B7IFS9_PORTR|nr:hypothetical protein [Portunus trituberculatus]